MTTSDSAPDRERVDFGKSVLRVHWKRLWLRMDVRAIAVAIALGLICIVVALFGLATGEYSLSVSQVVRALFTESSDFTSTVVNQWRLPRVIAAIVFGAALGVSGAIFQSLTRNPLASPDIVGFSAGAYTGALVVIIVMGGTYVEIATGALVGGLATAALVYVLAFKQGIRGFRLIIIGIGVSAMLGSVNTWLLLTTDLDTAMIAAVWGAGSLNGITWQQTSYGSLIIVVLLALALVLARPLRQLELGDDAAAALGVRIESTRLWLILISVALVAAVTAAAGPISFVALAAPQVARRLARSPGVSLIGSAVTGAALLAASDYAAQHALPAMLPVGTVTVVIGGGYLVWLLIHEARRRP